MHFLRGSRGTSDCKKNSAMKSHFTMMADYNAWANSRLYRMASQLPDEQYRRDVGAYFKSLHGTLNHIMCAGELLSNNAAARSLRICSITRHIIVARYTRF